MVTFLLITLGISIVGLVLTLTIKRYELRSGRRLMQGMRPGVDRGAEGLLRLLGHILPSALKRTGMRLVLWLTVVVSRVLMRVTRYCEHVLERLLHRVRKNSAPLRSGKEASSFLREVAEHKRSLADSRDHAIFEE